MRSYNIYYLICEFTFFHLVIRIGATIGRIANRIKNCEFPLQGKTYKVSCNEKNYDTIHGGVVCVDRRGRQSRIKIPPLLHFRTLVKCNRNGIPGELGFPGELKIRVTHTITESNTWEIAYSGETDSETVVAMTNYATLTSTKMSTILQQCSITP